MRRKKMAETTGFLHRHHHHHLQTNFKNKKKAKFAIVREVRAS